MLMFNLGGKTITKITWHYYVDLWLGWMCSLLSAVNVLSSSVREHLQYIRTTLSPHLSKTFMVSLSGWNLLLSFILDDYVLQLRHSQSLLFPAERCTTNLVLQQQTQSPGEARSYITMLTPLLHLAQDQNNHCHTDMSAVAASSLPQHRSQNKSESEWRSRIYCP